MDGDGLTGGCGDLQLSDEGCVLRGNVGVVEMVVVEADFPDGDAARVLRERGQLRKIFRGGLVRFLRMNAGGCINLWVQMS